MKVKTDHGDTTRGLVRPQSPGNITVFASSFLKKSQGYIFSFWLYFLLKGKGWKTENAAFTEILESMNLLDRWSNSLLGSKVMSCQRPLKSVTLITGLRPYYSEVSLLRKHLLGHTLIILNRKSLIIHPNKSGLPRSWLVKLGYS